MPRALSCWESWVWDPPRALISAQQGGEHETKDVFLQELEILFS